MGLGHTVNTFSANISKTPPVDCVFNVGDRVTFTNDYGVSFNGLRVIGFDDTPSYGRSVYLDCDCYWFAKNPNSLTLEKSY